MMPDKQITKHNHGAFIGSGMMVGGAVHSMLPRGMFAEHDVLVRAIITGIVAGASIIILSKIFRRKRSTPTETT